MLRLKAISISIILLALASPRVASAGSCAPNPCVSKELVIGSGVLVGEVVLSGDGKIPRGSSVEIQLFEFRKGEWKYFGTVISNGRFGWPDITPGKYMLIARYDGFKEAKVSVRVNRRKGKLKDIIIPLKLDGCADAKLRGRRSMLSRRQA